MIILYKNGKVKRFLTHRIVANVFIKNDKNKKCVNHKDGNKKNNKVNNLEWVTYSENNNHAYRLGLMKKGKERKDTKPVLIFDKNNNLIKYCETNNEAAKYLGVCSGSISSACNKEHKCKGFILRYETVIKSGFKK